MGRHKFIDCFYLNQTYTEDDILILSIGSNDNNPYEIISNLCNTLCNFKKCKIFVLSVQYNNHLNIHKLNSKIDLIVRNYDNCHFIKTDQLLKSYIFKKKTSIIQKISFKLNIEINFLKYKQKFLNNIVKISNDLKYRNNCVVKNTLLNSQNQPKIIKKGTIPYYFGLKQKDSNTNEIPEQSSICFRP
ncbi:unnamed protein product [Diatraea saccharalis]|uniref:Uncharacterized protein n=1 Tax=Diatraea saccharalis TaxID=40085 RepID=A0A9N9R642_9NEOP|nr:unnamed protein product [Diatraea saccharalis]